MRCSASSSLRRYLSIPPSLPPSSFFLSPSPSLLPFLAAPIPPPVLPSNHSGLYIYIYIYPTILYGTTFCTTAGECVPGQRRAVRPCPRQAVSPDVTGQAGTPRAVPYSAGSRAGSRAGPPRDARARRRRRRAPLIHADARAVTRAVTQAVTRGVTRAFTRGVARGVSGCGGACRGVAAAGRRNARAGRQTWRRGRVCRPRAAGTLGCRADARTRMSRRQARRMSGVEWFATDAGGARGTGCARRREMCASAPGAGGRGLGGRGAGGRG